MESRRRLITFAAVAAVLGLLVAVQRIYFERGLIPGDAFNYLAAGERLNAGHDLYALSAGDRLVDIHPPYWLVPFVSPPPMAVLFRVFALLGDAGAYVWWGIQLAALATSLVLLLRRKPLLTAGAVLILLVPLVYEIGVGNVNSFLLLGLIVTWRAYGRGEDGVAGAVTGVATAVKLTPGIVGWWLITQGRWRAIRASVAAGLVSGVISIVGAGIGAHVRYMEILRDGGVTPSALSLGGMLEFIGLPEQLGRLVPIVAIVVGLAAVWLLRDRPGISFGAAVVTMIAGSPAVSINWYILLLALLAPVAWPVGDSATRGLVLDQLRTKIEPSLSR